MWERGFYFIRKCYTPSHDIAIQSIDGKQNQFRVVIPACHSLSTHAFSQNNYTNILYLFVWFCFVLSELFLPPNGKRHRIVRKVFLCPLKFRYFYKSKHAFPISIPTGPRTTGQPIFLGDIVNLISFDFLSHFSHFHNIHDDIIRDTHTHKLPIYKKTETTKYVIIHLKYCSQVYAKSTGDGTCSGFVLTRRSCSFDPN